MHHSEQIDQLAPAFVQLQGALSNPKFDSRNPYHDSEYVSLAGARNHVHQRALDLGFAIVQSCSYIDGPEYEFQSGNSRGRSKGAVLCRTTLIHSSGQWVASDSVIAPNKGDAQGWGGAMKYARRYGLLAALNLVGDKDDDGNYGLNAPDMQDFGAARGLDQPSGPPPFVPQDEPNFDRPAPPAQPRPIPQQRPRQAPPQQQQSSAPRCPDCGSEMRERRSQRGPFWGCSQYPNCKGIVPMT